MYKYIIFIIIILLAVSVTAQTDSALVRIRVDVDSAKVRLNNQEILEDSYGNALIKNSWFILNLPIETYNLKIISENYDPIDSTLLLVKNEIYTFDIQFIEKKYEDTAAYFKEIPESVEVVKLVLHSEPDSSSIIFGKEKLDEITPTEMYFRPGEYSFQMSKEGFDPLKSTVTIVYDTPILANFMLAEIKPVPLLPESLGLSYMSQMPMLEKKLAEKVKTKYNALTESFAIFPLAQGILARFMVDESQHSKANGLIFSGIGLTLGSYILGKILYKRKQAYIVAENERREADNAMVESNNQTVDQAVRDENAARMKVWLRGNRNRGTVVIENLE